MARSRFNDPIEPMTLENMHRNGVRFLWIKSNLCRHRTFMNVDHLPGDLTVPERRQCYSKPALLTTPASKGEFNCLSAFL